MSDNTTNNNASGNGNVAALREAVERSTRRLESLVSYIPPEWEKYVNADIRANLSALAETPRNCDVGTPEQQSQRFYNFCQGHSSAIAGMCDPNCPCIGSVDKCHCLCQWEKLPYETEAQSE